MRFALVIALAACRAPCPAGTAPAPERRVEVAALLSEPLADVRFCVGQPVEQGALPDGRLLLREASTAELAAVTAHLVVHVREGAPASGPGCESGWRAREARGWAAELGWRRRLALPIPPALAEIAELTDDSARERALAAVMAQSVPPPPLRTILVGYRARCASEEGP